MKALRTLAVSTSVLLALAACNSGPKVPGKYSLDTKAMVAKMKAGIEKAKDASGPANAAGKMADMMVKMVEGMKAELTFTADGKFTSDFTINMMGTEQKKSATGTWKLQGDKITMASTTDGKEETRTGTFRDGKITVVADNGGKRMEMIFVRQS